MTAEFRILIIGGYGIFGGRLVQLLEGDARLTVLVAGRSLDAAREYCGRRSHAVARLIPTLFDRTRDDPAQLAALRPTVVVDASGPFQGYGSRRYQVIEHCIANGSHYLDLADGSDFVAGVPRFDAAAKAAGVYVLSGVSSFPVLTAAVVHRLSIGVADVQSIRGGIAPSPYAGVGVNVIRAIASYAGQRVSLRRHGETAVGRPFTESMRFVIAVPGHVPLKSTRFSLVDVPDLRTLPDVWPQAGDVWMGAGPVPVPLHWMLSAFAWLVRVHLLSSLSWMAKPMHFVTNRVRWGEHRGGMFVEVRGRCADGTPCVREWHLLAEGDDGPLIPCMAIAAILGNALAGRSPAPGARTALADVDLSDYESLFSRRTIYSGIRERLRSAGMPLYEAILGDSWPSLPPPIRQLHSVTSTLTFAGRCDVDRGRNPLAWLVAEWIGFPRTGADQRIEVTLSVDGEGERWVRSCGGRSFTSMQGPGKGRAQWLVRERFGPVAVDMALVAQAAGLRYVLRRWTFFGVPLPMWLGPRSTASESIEDGKFKFDVAISHPITGLIVRYRGTLAAATPIEGQPIPAAT
jgi:hypothetical protein